MMHQYLLCGKECGGWCSRTVVGGLQASGKNYPYSACPFGKQSYSNQADDISIHTILKKFVKLAAICSRITVAIVHWHMKLQI